MEMALRPALLAVFISVITIADPSPQFIGPSLIGPSLSSISFTFTCDFSHAYSDPNVMFDILWKFNNVTFKTVSVQAPAHSSSIDHKSWTGHLGQMLSCSVRSYFNNSTQNSFSEEKTSSSYHGGITVQTANPNLTEGQDTQITVSSTLPILCSSGTGNCSLDLQVVLENNNTLPGTDLLFQSCVVRLYSMDYQSSNNTVSAVTMVTMPMNQILVSEKQQVVTFEVVGNNQADISWNGHVGTKLILKTQDIAHGQCSMFGNGNVDIFNKTYGKAYLEMEHNSGDYIMYRADQKNLWISPLEIHVRLMVERNISARVCAIAVQNGGEVVTIDMCSKNKTEGAPFLTSTRPDNPAMAVYTCDLASYLIYTDDDVALEVRIQEQNLDVNLNLPPSYSQNGLGLCSFEHQHWNLGFNDLSFLRLDAASSFFAEGKNRFTKSTYVRRPDYSRCEAKVTSIHRRITDSVVYKINQCRSIKPKNDKLYHDWNIHMKAKSTYHPFPLHPTPNTGIDSHTASNKCRELEAEYMPYMCLHATSNDFLYKYLQSCQAESVVENGYNLVTSALQGMLWGCQHWFLQNEDMYIPDATTGLLKPTPVLTDFLCQGFCSLNGQCQSGHCHCSRHYTGNDCSMSVYGQATILGIIDGGVCGDSIEDCPEPLLITRNVVDGTTLVATLVPIQFTGLYGTVDTTKQHHTALPVVENKYSVSVNVSVYANKDVSLSGFQITLLYQGKPTNSVNYLIVDTTCLDCSAASLNCTIKKDKCFINNKCFYDGDRDLANLQDQCDPGRNQTHWTAV